MKEHEPPQTIGDVIEQHPNIKPLVDTLDLQIVKE